MVIRPKASSQQPPGTPDARGYWFDSVAADRADQFFERYLKHVKGEFAGKPFRLEPWERDRIIRPMFGWKRRDGTRRYRVVWVEVPRKNGKSALASGVATYLFTADGEPGAEVYSAAGDREQASIVFDTAKAMIAASPALSKRTQVYKRSILYPADGSVYRVLSADSELKHGLNGHGVIFDELHVQRNRDLWDVLKTSQAARRQPMTFTMTTAGFDRNSICWELHEYALKVQRFVETGGQEGIDDPSWLVVIYAADEKDNWKDPAVWKKANPNLGVSVKLEYLQEEAKRAELTPAYENTFRRLHLNQWTSQSTRWMPMDAWDASAGVVDPDDLLRQPCYAGLDLSSTIDLTALVLVFKIEEVFKVLPYFWIPAENIEQRAKRDGAPYDLWARNGLIEATPGNVVDYGAVLRRLEDLGEVFDIREIAYDRWGAAKLSQDIQDRGFTVVPFGQGFGSMSAPMKEMLGLVMSKRLHHGGHPVLRWMADNLMARQDPAGNVKPDKEKSKKKIDGIVAMIMGLDRAIRTEGGSSVYETRGIRAL